MFSRLIARKGKILRRVEKYLKKNKLIQILIPTFIMVMAVTVVLQNVLPVSAKTGANSPYNQSNLSYHYFYNQLSDESKRIYEAMEEMYENDIFARGEDYDLSANGKVTAAQLQSFVNGSSKLIDDYCAARDAFQYDYPDVFYVDFSLLSVRVVKDSDGVLHGYLGAGRSASYLLRTFTKENIPDAVKKYEEAIDRILKDLPTTAAADESLAETQIYYIHDYLTHNMIYHYENEVSNADCNSRTAYDALYFGEGVCEAYTRGFKALMDRVGIPTICVYGVYRPSEAVNEMHIWNYVQIDGKWYGVDVTQDDPVVKGSTNKTSGRETREFCLVGAFDLNPRHIPSGIMSTAYYEFKYPALESESIREVNTYVDKDLVVVLKEDFYSEDSDEILKSGTFYVSYRGKNYTQNAAEGYYILSKYGQYYPESDEWYYSDWAYITPQYYDVGGEGMEPSTPDSTMVPEGASGDGYGDGYYLYLPMPHVMKAQFAVTTVPPSFKYTNGQISGSLFYEGDPAFFAAVSEEINNKWGTYVAPPYPETVSPVMYQNMKIGSTYHIKVVYDDDLKDDGTGAGVGIKISQESAFSHGVITGEDYSRVENVIWDNARTVEFDFTPSKQYADNQSYYNLQVTGLVGTKSGKKPIALNYACVYASSYCSLGVGGFNWRIFGQPQLLDTSDIDTSGWEGYDMETGEKYANVDILEKISNRLMLVTQEPTPAKSKEMTDMLESEFSNETFLTEKTYNIQLSLCKCMIIKTGEGVRVCVGFPEGYDYSSLDRGVTYKAYHYEVDRDTNQLTGKVEEIRCFVTEYGLIIECDSFSPFTIAAVKSNDQTVANKAVMFQSDANGAFYDGDKKLEGHDGFIELTSNISGGNAKAITIKANEGYIINAVVVNNRRIQLDGNTTEHTIHLDYNNYDKQTVVASAEFISAKVYEQDIENGFSNDIVSDYPDDSTNVSTVTPSPNQSANSSSQTPSGSGNNGNSSQTASGSNNGDSTQPSPAPDNNDNTTTQTPVTGGNSTANQSREQAKSGQKKDSPSNKTLDSSSGSDLSASNKTTAESQPESIDSASVPDITSPADITGVYDSGDVEIGEDDIDKDNVLMFIIVIVAIAGIVAAGFAVFVLRKNGER